MLFLTILVIIGIAIFIAFKLKRKSDDTDYGALLRKGESEPEVTNKVVERPRIQSIPSLPSQPVSPRRKKTSNVVPSRPTVVQERIIDNRSNDDSFMNGVATAIIVNELLSDPSPSPSYEPSPSYDPSPSYESSSSSDYSGGGGDFGGGGSSGDW